MPERPSDESKITELIERLHQRTESGRLDWEEGYDETTFQTSLPGFGIRLLRREREGGLFTNAKTRYVLEVLNERGNVIEEIDDHELDRSSFLTITSAPAETLRELYKMARRSALNVGKQLDQILDALEK